MAAGRARDVEAAVARVPNRAEAARWLVILVKVRGAAALSRARHLLWRDRPVAQAVLALSRAWALARSLAHLVLVVVLRAWGGFDGSFDAVGALGALEAICRRRPVRGWIEGASPTRRGGHAAVRAVMATSARLGARGGPLCIHMGRGAQIARCAWLGQPVNDVQRSTLTLDAAQFHKLAISVTRAGGFGAAPQ